MKRTVLGLAMVLAGSGVLWAADLRDVQSQLKEQGFYFGEVDGQNGESTTAALRRFQIRNGLEVTGTADTATLQSLGLGEGGEPTGQVAPAPVPQENPPPTRPPVNLRRENTVVESDRRALRQEEAREQPAPPPVPPRGGGFGPEGGPDDRFRQVFTGTPYVSAPRVVQEETLLRAQRLLASRGLLREADGVPGPATEEAIFSYQRTQSLPTTGRLDLQTLAIMRLLPGEPARGIRPPVRNGPNRVAPPRAYRGIWVD